MSAQVGGPIRLIVTDLDGTLLSSAHVVTPFTAQAVQEAIARGVLFTVATGKTYPSTTGLIQQFGINIPLICGNGTQVFAPDGTLLYEAPIPRDVAIEAVQLAQAGGFTPIVYLKMGLLAQAWDANVAEVVAHHEPAPEIADDLQAALAGRYTPYKLILMSQDRASIDDFDTQLRQAFEGRAQVLRSGLASVVEVLPLGVTKATALTHILDYLGLSAEATMSFGDNCNDLDMIRMSGIGVAMGHAPEDVRSGANYVTGTNDEDGVGHAIRRFVLDAQPVGTR
ncbi:MAG: HAD family phosphatase [Chloroflexi bacterium]|nr:HAD family phosphatase [Chloroflexota bacterium]